MILTIDVGNTNVVIGCVENGEVKSVCRLATNLNDLSSDYALKMRQSFEFDGIDYKNFPGAIISSVVPPVLNSCRTAVRKLTGKTPMIVGPGIRTGLNIQMENPAQIGSDLIVAAVAALSRFEPPLIIIDMGTATTIVAIDKDGAYTGGAIVPGIKLSYTALSSGTSLLPNIAIEAPAKCIGTNTVDSMKSGAVYGAAALVDGMIDRMEEELGETVTVVATGGLAGTVVPHCKRKIEYEPALLLKGLAILYEKNTKRRKQQT